MQRTKSLAMGVVGPRHQLGKTFRVVLLSPSSGATPAFQRPDTHSWSFQWHSRTLIPWDGAQHLPHNSSGQQRLVEQQCQAGKGRCGPGQGKTMAKNHVERARPRAAAPGSAPGDAHTSPRDAAVALQASSPCSTCSKQSQFALKTLLLEQF